MKIIISVLILFICFNQIVLSDYTYFKVQTTTCKDRVVEVDGCSKNSAGGCADSIKIAAKDDDDHFSLSLYSNDGACSSDDAYSTFDFTCLQEGVALNVSDYNVTCYTSDPNIPKYSFFKVEKHLCNERRDMELDSCLSVSTAEIPNCNGSVNFSFGTTYNFNVFTNDDCGGAPFRVGPFNCAGEGEQIQARGFVVTCYSEDYLSSSSKLSITLYVLLSTFNKVVLSASNYNYFNIQNSKCEFKQVSTLGDCSEVTSEIEGCTANSVEVVYYGENSFTLETFSDKTCSPKALSSVNFTCTEEGTPQTVGDYTFTCFAEDPRVPKYNYFSVLQNRCDDGETAMALSSCYFINNTNKPQCTGSVDIQHSFGNTFNFDVYTNNNCSGTPFRVGPFNCTGNGETVASNNFNVTCYLDDPNYDSSSSLSVSIIFNLFLLFSLILFFN
ncbi:hypothetical protein DICPUDRAFT_156146 [Dictyostelium purpureum]|uniref:MRH domain-containing protein n=1 Tax=Dictyostelium purpureum TaxID=5786 RepID=F0ZVU5_DICPU|nr:uncharacterized protein DICPUDRAFT_156146 [Dictyostelium purpureum]EGC31933.1 hypothetical protein DICPUDRAFT_156146 [Dictyostelium purpureum]|eukprot:XP_003291535.1 hypothetical protein DICPUDRAFT_156146 [Dictyostelium purpureum]